MAESFFFTSQGLVKIRQQGEQLEEKLRELESQVSEAAETGGNQWHDNFSYEQLTQQIRGFDYRLKDLHVILNNAVLAQRPTGGVVAIGVKIKIKFNSEEESWLIAGFGESDPDNEVIAYNTPLAALVMGKKAGETAKGTLGGKLVQITILEIEVVDM